MNRKTWFLPLLLLVTGVVVADEATETGEAASTAAVQTQAQAQAQEPSQDQSREQESVPPQDQAREQAQVRAQAPTQNGPKQISGMSILGNQEAPKSLVIVPWKSSEIGDSLGISSLLDDSLQPVDRDVFIRELSYYEIRSQSTP